MSGNKIQSETSVSKQHVHSNRWVKLRQKWKHRGVIEVNEHHRGYHILNCLRNGIRDLLYNHQNLGPKVELNVDDHRHVIQNTETICGKTYIFSSYASSVFASIRHAVSVSELEFLESIAPSNLPYLEFISNSKSGQHFYLSNDQQYILKTDRKYYIDYFMSFLSEYLEHFQTYPHSLIVKFLGLYSVEIPGKSNSKIYFLAMQNVFSPPDRIDTRFDIKGCVCGRYQKPSEKGKPVLTAMKDANFLDEVIELGHQKNWFIKQLKLDVKFLETLGVQDYSLLVGRHALHENERHQSFGSLVMRMTKSFSNKDDIDLSSSIGKNSLYIPDDTDLMEEESKPDISENVGKVYFENPAKPKTFLFHSLVHLRDIDDGKNTANRRLLPHCKNPLHVIDGVHNRYFVGIIDFFTQFETRQRAVKILKDIRYCCGEHSTVPAAVYADRFLHFITERTE